jgi:hypothetical protein
MKSIKTIPFLILYIELSLILPQTRPDYELKIFVDWYCWGYYFFLAGFLIYVTEIKKSTYNSDRIQQEFGK